MQNKIKFKQDQIKVAKAILAKRVENVNLLKLELNEIIKLVRTDVFQASEFNTRKIKLTKQLNSAEIQAEYWRNFVKSCEDDLLILETLRSGQDRSMQLKFLRVPFNHEPYRARKEETNE